MHCMRFFMKRPFSNTLLLAFCLAIGLLVLRPTSGSAEVLTGRILEVHLDKSQLVLHPGPDMEKGYSTLTVSYTPKVSASGKEQRSQLPACIQPGIVVQVQGSYTDQEHTEFNATGIRRMHQVTYQDATGVRARLDTCRHGQ